MSLQHVTEEEGHKTREYLQYRPNNCEKHFPGLTLVK